MKRKNFILAGILLAFLLLANLLNAYNSKFATNITPLQAYDMLLHKPNTYLIDVRSRYEYQLIGHPMWVKNGKVFMAYNIPFMFLTKEFAAKGQKYGNGKIAKVTRYQFVPNPDFIKWLKKKFKPSDNLIFMCRSTKRSHKAADLAYKAGFKNSYNLLGGFEGYRFAGKYKYEKELAKKYSFYYGKPARFNGWKWYGLPWTYKIDPKYVYPADLKK